MQCVHYKNELQMESFFLYAYIIYIYTFGNKFPISKIYWNISSASRLPEFIVALSFSWNIFCSPKSHVLYNEQYIHKCMYTYKNNSESDQMKQTWRSFAVVNIVCMQ